MIDLSIGRLMHVFCFSFSLFISVSFCSLNIRDKLRVHLYICKIGLRSVAYTLPRTAFEHHIINKKGVQCNLGRILVVIFIISLVVNKVSRLVCFMMRCFTQNFAQGFSLSESGKSYKNSAPAAFDLYYPEDFEAFSNLSAK